MLSYLSFKHISRQAKQLRPSQNIINPVVSHFNQQTLFQKYSILPNHFHAFRPFYPFSATKQSHKENQQSPLWQQSQQAKNVIIGQTVQPNQNLKEEDQRNKELELIFAKNKKKQEQKFDPEQQLTDFENKVKNTNINVLKRELFNDSMQLPIKFLAYSLAGHASVGTFFAEFCRSSIDAINHLMLYLTNYIDVKPNKQYPQGTENIKYLVVIVPSLLFFFFGGFTIYSSFIEYLSAAPPEVSDGNNLYSILLYLASFGIEISVIAYNIRDSIKMQNINSTQNNQKFSLQTLIGLIGKKDPLLQAVLYENMITLMSMSVPLLVGSKVIFLTIYYQFNFLFLIQVSNMIQPSNLPEFIGQNIIGLIQLMLGYRLGKETIQALLGKSVEEEIMNDIHEEILKNPYVISIRDEKGIMSGSVRFKYNAIVEYDFEALNEDAMEDYRQMSDYIVYSQDYKDRQEELEELMESLPLRLLKEIKRQEQDIIESIKRKYPQCDYFDINIDNDKLQAFLHDEEKIKNSFHYELDSDEEFKEETEEEKVIKEWVLAESDKILSKNFIKKQMTISKSEDQLIYENLHFKINPKHYSNSLNFLFIQENTLINEKQRIDIIQDELDFENNYKNNDDPL